MRPETVHDLIWLTQELADLLGISLEEVEDE
jgi:hypothetical protein